ncbi:DUF2255 family protein [Promicromonospora sukumoe]|uniref:DUF2255 family protein n=1 Tax=Promicromonospora sukumoe TaxID=88382 RepID=UPI0037C6C9FE
MITWTGPELDSLGRARVVRMAGRRSDGWLHTLVQVWHVVVDGGLYVRSAGGAEDLWYRGASEHADGAIRWDGLVREVTYTLDVDHPTQISAAYEAKYGTGPEVPTAPGRCDTVRIQPR